MAHSAKVEHLINAAPEGVELNFRQELNGKKPWESLYNKPVVNYGISYYNLNNEEQLGELFIASAALDIPLDKRKFTDLFVRIGTGVVYSTNPYDRDKNNQNTMVGSPFTFLIQSRLTYEIKINNNFKLTPNINITHASNGAQSLPNRGINMVTANIGCSYRLTTAKILEDAIVARPKNTYNFKYYGLFSTGKHVLSLQNRVAKPFFNFALVAQKYLSQKSDLQMGVEYFHSESLKENIRESWFQRQRNNNPDFRRAGLFVGHELKADKLGFIAQFGMYVYNPSKSNHAVYQRYGLKYEFLQHAVAQIGLKVHAATAEAIEFSVGYKL